MNKSFAVLGLGIYGSKLTQTLVESGAEVLVADIDKDKVKQFADIVDTAIVADLSSEEAIRALGIGDMDVVVICMGEKLENSILCAMIAKELGVPKVMAKATSRRMGEILKKIGVDEVIFPEEEAAFRTAKRLVSQNFLDYYDLDDNLCLVNMKPKAEWVGKSLVELKLRNKYDVTVVAIKEPGGKFEQVDPHKPLEENSLMLMVIHKKNIKKLN